EPLGDQINLVVYLSEASTAGIDQIVGTLACGGDIEGEKGNPQRGR
ncbi:MAG: hypothetical protein ACI8S3_002272, partial [Alphaproteobacteria bacterium]